MGGWGRFLWGCGVSALASAKHNAMAGSCDQVKLSEAYLGQRGGVMTDLCMP